MLADLLLETCPCALRRAGRSLTEQAAQLGAQAREEAGRVCGDGRAALAAESMRAAADFAARGAYLAADQRWHDTPVMTARELRAAFPDQPVVPRSDPEFAALSRRLSREEWATVGLAQSCFTGALAPGDQLWFEVGAGTVRGPAYFRLW